MRLSTLFVGTLVAAVAFKAVFGSGQLVLAGLLLAVMWRAVHKQLPRSRSNSGARGAPKAAAKRPEDPNDIPLAALLLVATACVAEKLETQSRAVGQSAMPTYITLAFAFVCSTWAADVNAANGSTDAAAKEQRKALGFIATVASVVLYLITLKVSIAASLLAALFVAHETFHGLRTKIGVQEAFLVASLCALFAADAVSNNAIVGLNELAPQPQSKLEQMQWNVKQPVTTTVQHVVGRTAFVAAWLFCWLFGRLCAPFWVGSSAATKHVAAFASALAAFAVATGHTAGVLYFAVGSDAFAAVHQIHHVLIGNGTVSAAAAALAAAPTSESVSAFFPVYCVAAWIVIIPVASAVSLALPESWMPRILRRKLFHGIAVTAFVFPTAIEPGLMGMWWCIAAGSCCVIEALRSTDTLGIGRLLTPLLSGVVDARDNALVRTHLYLMVGCGLSLVLNHRHVFHFQQPPPWHVVSWRNFLPGLGALGVVDAAAAVVGVTVGGPTLLAVLRPVLPTSWIADNEGIARKTVAGTIGACLVGAIAGLLPLLCVTFGDAWLTATPSLTVGGVSPGAWAAMAGATACVAVYEAVTDGVDNLELPLVGIVVSRLLLA